MNKNTKISKTKDKQSFEDIKHIDEYGNEYWYARELQQIIQGGKNLTMY